MYKKNGDYLLFVFTIANIFLADTEENICIVVFLSYIIMRVVYDGEKGYKFYGSRPAETGKAKRETAAIGA
jgi:hypothetical protein